MMGFLWVWNKQNNWGDWVISGHCRKELNFSINKIPHPKGPIWWRWGGGNTKRGALYGRAGEELREDRLEANKWHLTIQWPGAPMVSTIPVPQTIHLFPLPAIYSSPREVRGSLESGKKELSARWESEEADTVIPNAGSPAWGQSTEVLSFDQGETETPYRWAGFPNHWHHRPFINIR